MPRPKGSLGNAIIAFDAFLNFSDFVSVSERLRELKTVEGIYPISHFADPKVLRRYVPKVWVRLLLGYTNNRSGVWRLASGGAFDGVIEWYLKCGVDVLEGADCWTVRELFMEACASTSILMVKYLYGRLNGGVLVVELTQCKSLEICKWLIARSVILSKIGYWGNICPHIFDYLYDLGMFDEQSLQGILRFCVNRETVLRAYLILASGPEWDLEDYLDWLIPRREMWGLIEKLKLLEECLERVIDIERVSWGELEHGERGERAKLMMWLLEKLVAV